MVPTPAGLPDCLSGVSDELDAQAYYRKKGRRAASAPGSVPRMKGKNLQKDAGGHFTRRVAAFIFIDARRAKD